MASLIVLWILYLLPSIIVADNKKKTSKAPTVVVNLFLGWTLIGWVIALAMAVGKD